MAQQTAYLVILPSGESKVLTKIEEISGLEFENIEDANKTKIFEIEFKRQIKQNTKVTLSVSED